MEEEDEKNKEDEGVGAVGTSHRSSPVYETTLINYNLHFVNVVMKCSIRIL